MSESLSYKCGFTKSIAGQLRIITIPAAHYLACYTRLPVFILPLSVGFSNAGDNVCKVTFELEKEACEDTVVVNLVGDFNDWDKDATPLKKQKDGSFKVNLTLPVGNDFQFRYLINSEKWENDWSADKYTSSTFADVDNSVVIV